MANSKDKVFYLLPFLGLWIVFVIIITVQRPSPTKELQILPKGRVGYVQVPDRRVLPVDPNAASSGPNETSINAGIQLKLITWNLQGIYEKILKERTEAVLLVVQKEFPDIFMCQELVDSSYEQLIHGLETSYSHIIGTSDGKPSRYFTGIFFKTKTFKLENHKVTPFPNSDNGRTKFEAKFHLADSPKVRLAVLNTHLASLPHRTQPRLEQLEECISTCVNYSDSYNVIFAGDLNLEENEEKGKIPEEVKDLWVEAGSPKETQYTWDSEINKNDKSVVQGQLTRVRYDRMYYRNSFPPTMKFRSFQLLGKDRVLNTDYFPSDHWAIMSTFQLI